MVTNWQIWAIPIISALIGWGTNYLAIKMLFRPRRRLQLFGLRLQGLVPRRQAELAARIGETVERELISHADIERALQSHEIQQEVQRIIDDQIDQFIADTLGKVPLLNMLLDGGAAQQIRQRLASQINASAPAMLDRLMTRLESKLDFRQIVQEKIEDFDLDRLEKIIYQISANELKAIELLGGVLGFIIGLGQVALIQLS